MVCGGAPGMARFGAVQCHARAAANPRLIDGERELAGHGRVGHAPLADKSVIGLYHSAPSSKVLGSCHRLVASLPGSNRAAKMNFSQPLSERTACEGSRPGALPPPRSAPRTRTPGNGSKIRPLPSAFRSSGWLRLRDDRNCCSSSWLRATAVAPAGRRRSNRNITCCALTSRSIKPDFIKIVILEI